MAPYDYIKGMKDKPNDDGEACRTDYTLTELIHEYNKIKKLKEFRYELSRLHLNPSELRTLIEFFHCKQLNDANVSGDEQ